MKIWKIFSVLAICVLGLVFLGCPDGGDDDNTKNTGGDTKSLDTVVTPTAHPPEGNYYTNQNVTLTTETEDAIIYYTTDGSAPTASSTLYSSPISISATTTLKAIAVKDGMNNSSVLNAQYTFLPRTTVTNSADTSTLGTLRYAVTNAQDGDVITLSGVTSIELTSRLNISKNVTIEGNGVVITKSAAWTSSNSLLQISSSKEVSISRVYFKGGRGSYGGAISNSGTLTVESCIFSDNQATGSGGAVYNDSGNMTVKGCTFYGNSASNYGGALYKGTSGTFTLTGNLFYGNTASSYPVVTSYGTITSGGYNVVDVALGTSNNQSGWTSVASDKTISSLPISGKTFKLLSGSGAKNVITTLPAGYPAKDFYGDIIANGAAAGAVQESVSGSGYYLELSINNTQAGSVDVTPAPDEDGLYSGTTTLTATAQAGCSFAYWLVNGVKQTGNPLTVTSHTKVAAVFTRSITVTSNADTSTSGTLRYAVTNAQDGDIISVNSGVTSIELTSRLNISKNIIIEGNGVVITKSTSWTADSSLLQTSSGTEVSISRVHFKGGRGSSGGTIYNYGTLTVESCIFSDNQATSAGGAINNPSSSVTVKGCTFYNNSTGTYGGGAIYIGIGATLTITGNLFYGNTGDTYPVIFGNYVGTITSGGYNVVDVALGTSNNQSGWTSVASDKTFSSLGISSTPFDTTNFVPVTALRSVMPSTPISDFPTTDFKGDTRTWTGAPGAVK